MPNQDEQIPIKSDFINWWSLDLDERHAVQMFLGKTPEQAEAMFRRNFLAYQEDLGYMKAPAFQFYVRPAIRYLLSKAANGDPDAASTFCYLLEFRLRYDPESIRQIGPLLIDAVQNILEQFDRFECDLSIYGDVPKRYRIVLAQLPG